MWRQGLCTSARLLRVAMVVCALAGSVRAEEAGEKAEPGATAKSGAREQRPAFASERLQGKVVWLADALQRRFGIVVDADARHAAVALETFDGQIVPIVKDARGRAFHLDPRLRDVPLELLVRRYEGSPVVQVIRMYRLRDDGKYELDYWCDICAIAMYELKSCECCQGETRLRERPVVDGQTQPEGFSISADEPSEPSDKNAADENANNGTTND